MAEVRSPDTRERILDAAERLFMAHGYEGTSMRQITGEAGVNLAAVNYHLGSKEALVQEVFRRRLDWLNDERMRVLNAMEAEAAGKPRHTARAALVLVARLPQQLHRAAQKIRLCAKKLHNERLVFGQGHEQFVGAGAFVHQPFCTDHFCNAHGSPVFAAQQPEGQIAVSGKGGQPGVLRPNGQGIGVGWTGGKLKNLGHGRSLVARGVAVAGSAWADSEGCTLPCASSATRADCVM